MSLVTFVFFSSLAFSNRIVLNSGYMRSVNYNTVDSTADFQFVPHWEVFDEAKP